MACTSHVLHTPEPHGHFVQLYNGDARRLATNVAHYLSEGFSRGEGAIVIATVEHRALFVRELQQLGVRTDEAVSESRFLLLDAEQTLGEFMIDGEPDWLRFERVITAAIDKVRLKAPAGLRAYGEMVGILWTARQYTAAIRLEEFWNKLLQDGGFTLFCSYPIDIFAKDFQISGVDALLCDHTHLIPTGTDEALESAINRAMDERLGARANGLRLLIKAVRQKKSWVDSGSGSLPSE